MNDSDDFRVVLSAPQLSAILAHETISRSEMLSNRFWGSLQVVGGVLEMAGAAALCVLPEPTMASKAGCIAFGVHGSDTAAAGLRQAWTGRDTTTLTQQGVTQLAQALKASPEMAGRIGLTVDMVVPFAFAGSVKAVRATQITMGRISLDMHEARAGSRLGGHTIAKHVGKTEAQLLERLRLEPRITMASSFKNLQEAEWAISHVMGFHNGAIRNWILSKSKRRLELQMDVGRKVGYGVFRNSGEMREMSKVKIIMDSKEYNGMPYFILTSYLIP